MGGQAFAQPGPNGEPALNIPRMPHQVYSALRDKCMAILSKVYEQVACPHEAPDKADHGDVDILVSRPRRDISGQEIGVLLGAVRQNINNPVSRNFAVPLPNGETGTYAQVDVHFCEPGFLRWEMLMGSYGDLMQIVGRFLRHAGFTANDKGLHVRIPEIEADNQKPASMVFLTADPSELLDFLGLDEAQWDKGFETQECLFLWCCKGRFFEKEAFDSGEENTNDRQRMRKRKMFIHFVLEWLPGHPEVWHDREPWPGGEQLRKEGINAALDYFRRWKEYNDKMQCWEQQVRERKFWEKVGEIIPEDGDRLRVVKRSLRRWTRFDRQGPMLSSSVLHEGEQSSTWADEASRLGEAALLNWISGHWIETWSRERDREKAEKDKWQSNKARVP